MTEAKTTTRKKAPAKGAKSPTRITSANRSPLKPNLGKGHVIKV